MNLQEIQKRMEELSAEMLTLSNQMTRLISGQIVEPKSRIIVSWKQLRKGDRVGIRTEHGLAEFEIGSVEYPAYTGRLQVTIKEEGVERWINIVDLIANGKVTLI